MIGLPVIRPSPPICQNNHSETANCSRGASPPKRPLLLARYCRITPDAKTEISAPSGPSGSMIAGLRLLGEIARKLGSNGSPRPMDRAQAVRQAALLEHDRTLTAVRRRP